MGWEVLFYNTKVEAAIQKWPPGIKAKFSWIVELIEAFGIQKVGMPHVKALGNGLFEIRAKGKEGIGRALLKKHNGLHIEKWNWRLHDRKR